MTATGAVIIATAYMMVPFLYQQRRSGQFFAAGPAVLEGAQ
jgi:hypothetical protein